MASVSNRNGTVHATIAEYSAPRQHTLSNIATKHATADKDASRPVKVARPKQQLVGVTHLTWAPAKKEVITHTGEFIANARRLMAEVMT